MRGTLTVLAIFVLGGLVLWGLFFAAWRKSAPQPRRSPGTSMRWFPERARLKSFHAKLALFDASEAFFAIPPFPRPA